MWLRTFLLSVFIISIGFVPTSANSFEIPVVNVEVSVNEDGTILITEKLTYDFDGSFSWAEYELPRKGYTNISDIRVAEDGQNYINKNSEEPGTFSIARSDDSIQLKWHYLAEDEQRTFTISYTLSDAITIGPEWSQFFWNFLSADRDKSTRKLNIAILLPKSISPESLHGWTRGSSSMNLQKRTRAFNITATNIDNDEFAKARVVFPTSVFKSPKVAITDQQFSLSKAQRQEREYQKQLAEQKERRAYLAELWGQLNYVIAALSIVIFYFLYNKYGKRHPTSRFSSHETIMIPGNIRPATIGWLMQGRGISGNLLMATVLDLARRGYFKIQDQPPDDGLLSDDQSMFTIERNDQQISNELLSWEKDLINFIEEQISEDNNKLHKLFKNNSAGQWLEEWKQHFKSYCFKQDWIDEKSYTGAYWNGALQFFLLCSAIAAVVFAGPIALMSVFIALTTLILSISIIRRTPKGEEIYHKWQNYKNGLKNASEHTISTDQLDSHFVYAVAFNLQGKPIEHLIETGSDGVPVFAWFIFIGNTNSATAVAHTFSTLSSTGTATFSGSAGGAGASASAAGGGAAASAG